MPLCGSNDRLRNALVCVKTIYFGKPINLDAAAAISWAQLFCMSVFVLIYDRGWLYLFD